MDSLQLAKNLAKTVVPARIRSALRRMAHQRRVRGKPFPFVVEGPQASRTPPPESYRCAKIRTVAIIQLDLEGHEQRALTGALRTIRRCGPALVMETLPDAGWIARNLTLLGYRLGERPAENVVLACT
jgi:hypothetical protein